MAAAYAYAHLRGMGSWARCTLDGGKAFIELRDRLLGEGVSQAQVMPALDWPAPRHFNWALDYFAGGGARRTREFWEEDFQ